jgi:hypothetical protein
MSRYLFVGVIIGAILSGGFGMLLALIAGYWALKQLCDLFARRQTDLPRKFPPVEELSPRSRRRMIRN